MNYFFRDELNNAYEVLYGIIDGNTDVRLRSGWIGDKIPKNMFPKEYQEYINYSNDDGTCLWDKCSLYAKLLSTFDILIYEKEDTVYSMTNMYLLTFVSLDTYERSVQGIFDMEKKEIVYFKDIKILKLPAFDCYIKAATKIQRMWRKHVSTRNNNAAKVIQRTFLHYLYQPNGKFVQKLQQDFYMRANQIAV
jgi:hypothetical protein